VGLATDSGAWQTPLVIPVSDLTRHSSPEGFHCSKWRDRLELRNPGGGGNDRERPNFGKTAKIVVSLATLHHGCLSMTALPNWSSDRG